MTMPVNDRRVYVWEFPVRLYHWVNAICVWVLIVTGFVIDRPIGLGTTVEAYPQHWFGTVRFVHFVAAFVFFFNFLSFLVFLFQSVTGFALYSSMSSSAPPRLFH